MIIISLFRCDVTKPEDVAALYDAAEEYFKDKVLDGSSWCLMHHGAWCCMRVVPHGDGGVQVDIWCNNAGINHNSGWQKCMDIDIVRRHIFCPSFEHYFCSFLVLHKSKF